MLVDTHEMLENAHDLQNYKECILNFQTHYLPTVLDKNSFRKLHLNTDHYFQIPAEDVTSRDHSQITKQKKLIKRTRELEFDRNFLPASFG